MATHLILGGARSGKSAFAEKLAIENSLNVTYIATAQIYDAEFGKRVEHHKVRRPEHWQTIEQPFNLAETLQTYAKADKCVIVDCLTLWLAQCICPDCPPQKGKIGPQERALLLKTLQTQAGTILLVKGRAFAPNLRLQVVH